MTEDARNEVWSHQIRLRLTDEFAEIARADPAHPALRPLLDALARHDATLRNQFDAFADYVAEAERQGVEHFPLYRWTRATIEDPAKKAKHVKSFSIHVAGEEVYPSAAADALEAELAPLVGAGVVEALTRHDANPANNPQPPAHLR